MERKQTNKQARRHAERNRNKEEITKERHK